MRRVLVVALATLATGLFGLLPAGPASASAADDLARAQAKANQAARRLGQAQTLVAEAEARVEHARRRAAEADAQMAGTRSLVMQLAVRRYVGSSADDWKFLDMGDANQSATARVLTDVVTGESADALDRLRADREDLALELDAVERAEKTSEEALADLRAENRKAAAEVEKLAKRVQELEEQARRDAARQAAARTPAAASPAPAAAAGSAPAGAAASGDWLCPVQGARAFSDDYGDPRPGGNRHDGNDILSPRGTPVVASVAGTLTRNQSPRGGLSYYLKGDDGITYFGAHLDTYSAAPGRVGAGTQIGTVGTTGDASGGPNHLHFEMHPGGGRSINPYPTLTKYC